MNMTAEIERPEFVTDEHLDYLDALRESGVTNMFAAAPYLRDEFDMSRTASKATLRYWLRTFAQRHPERAGS